jgi:hypothetical protein
MGVSQYWTKDMYANLSTLDASGANSVVYAPGESIDVKRLIFVTTVAQTVADAVLTVAVRDVDNGNSTTIGTVTLAFTGSTADDVQYTDLGKPATTGTVETDGSLVFSSDDPGGVIAIRPGQELAITSNGGGDAGTYQVYVEYISKGFNPEVLDITDNELTFTHA